MGFQQEARFFSINQKSFIIWMHYICMPVYRLNDAGMVF
jgi:hypothetical protein